MQRLVRGGVLGTGKQVLVHAVAGAHIEQVVQAQQVVGGHGGAGLVAPGGPGAAVVQREGGAQGKPLHHLDHQVAVARPGIGGGRRFDLQVGFCRGQALEVLQALLDVAQVEQLAGGGGNGAGQRRAARQRRRQHRVGREADGRDAPGDHRQHQGAGGQVLRGGQHAGGDPAARNQGLLGTGQHHVDAGGAQAAVQRRVRSALARTRARVGQRRQDPLERLGALAHQRDAPDAKARALVVRDALDRGCRGTRQALVDAALVLLAQGALALLLALFFDEGLRRGGAGLGQGEPGAAQQQGQGGAGRQLPWQPAEERGGQSRHGHDKGKRRETAESAARATGVKTGAARRVVRAAGLHRGVLGTAGGTDGIGGTSASTRSSVVRPTTDRPPLG